MSCTIDNCTYINILKWTLYLFFRCTSNENDILSRKRPCGGCWWPGAHSAPEILQTPWRRNYHLHQRHINFTTCISYFNTWLQDRIFLWNTHTHIIISTLNIQSHERSMCPTLFNTPSLFLQLFDRTQVWDFHPRMHCFYQIEDTPGQGWLHV